MIHVRVTPDGGEAYDLVVDSRDVYQWERINRGATFSGWQESPTVTGLYQMTHLAARRQGMFTGPLDEFVETHAVDVIPAQPGDDPDPTRSAATRGRSSRSPSRRA